MRFEKSHNHADGVRWWTLIYAVDTLRPRLFAKCKILKHSGEQEVAVNLHHPTISFSRKESTDALSPGSGPSLRAATTPQNARLHHDRGADAGIGHRRQCFGLHAGQRDPAEEPSCGQARKSGEV